MEKTQKFLVGYSAIVTAVFACSVAFAHWGGPRAEKELTVQRLNIVEQDGSLRMVISGHARLPGVIVKGKEQPPHERPQAGMIFYNDETTEVGGIIFGGHRDAKGEVRDSGGMLSFDRYGANQIVQIMGVDDKEDKIVGLIVSDSPSGTENHRRIWLGRGADDNATLALLDGKGRKRLVMQVSSEGRTTITALDENGSVVKDLLETPRP